MGTLVLLVGGALGAVAAARYHVERFLAAPARKARRALERRRAVPLAHARDGAREKVVGTVVSASDALVAPISGRRCVAYEVVIEETEAARGWDTICREIRAVDFLLQDRDVTARVAMASSELALVLDHELDAPAGQARPAALTAFVAERAPSVLSRRIRLRAREGVLETGERASAYGMLGTERAAEGDGGDYRMAPSRRVIGPPGAAEKILVSDQKSAVGP